MRMKCTITKYGVSSVGSQDRGKLHYECILMYSMKQCTDAL